MALSAKVGTFTKSTGAAPVAQAVTGVGFQPKVLILWTVGQTTPNVVVAGDFLGAYGAATSPTNAYSAAAASAHAAATTNTSKRMAAKALTMVGPGEVTLVEADLTAFDLDGFTLNWTTNNATAYLIHYAALGGADITNATVLEWPAASAGPASLTGVGFRPDVIISFSSLVAAALPVSGVYLDYQFGVAAATGGQWSMHSRSADALNFSATVRTATADSGYCVADQAGTFWIGKAAVLSFDGDGFTARWLASSGLGGIRNLVLCIKGGRWQANTVNRTGAAAPAPHAIHAPGLTPRIAFMGSIGIDPSGTTATMSGLLSAGGYSLGASDGVANVCTAFYDQHNVDTTNVRSLSRNDKALVVSTSATMNETLATATFSPNALNLLFNPNLAGSFVIHSLIGGDTVAASGGTFVGADIPEGNYGLPVTAGATVHTKGAWRNMISALPFDTVGLVVNTGPTSLSYPYLLDIGIGEQGREVVLIPDIMGVSPQPPGLAFYVPMRLPAGTRVVARTQARNGGAPINLQIIGVGGHSERLPHIPQVTGYGINAAATDGTTPALPANINVKGAWTELVASTAHAFEHVILCIGINSSGTSGRPNRIDLGVGPAGSEAVVLPDYIVTEGHTSGMAMCPAISVLPVSVPAGSRVALRYQNNNLTARDMRVSLIGIGP
jgi:hypothetical protein